jgi:hypothetical protein
MQNRSLKKYHPSEPLLMGQAFNRHAEIGCIAAACGPKNKIARYLQKSGARLPAGIALEQWDPFHDFIVIFLFDRGNGR